jgi:hypothetical protein
MDLFNNETKTVEDVPTDQVKDKFLSGSHAVTKTQVIHAKRSDGSIGVVAPEHFADFLQKNGQLASPEEAQKYELDKKYGGVGGTLIAAGEGGVRGLTAGLSDPLAVGAARMFGGEKAATATREHLAGYKEAHPIASTAAEVGGALLPTIATAGGAAPEEAAALAARGGIEGAGALAEGATALKGATTALEGAGAAAEQGRMLGSIGGGLKTLGSTAGAIPRGIEALGEGTEHVLSNILGDLGETNVIGRTVQAAAKGAARSMVEGGLWSAGAAVSDATLKDYDLTAEKLMSTVTHGALLAGVLGGALSGAGHLLGEGVGRLVDQTGEATLGDAAGEQAVKSIQPSKAELRTMARHGGPAEVGNTFIDQVMRPALQKNGLKGVAMDATEKLEATHAAMDRIGGKIEETLAGTPATVSAAKVLSPFLKAAEEAAGSGKAISENVGPRLDKVRESFAKALGVDLTAPLEEQEIPVARLVEQRRELQKMAKFQMATPSEPIEHFRSISGQWNELEEDALNKASEGLKDTPQGTELRGLNRTYAQLADIERTLSRQSTGEVTKPMLGLTDILMGGGIGAPLALMSGHPVTAAMSLAGSFAHRAVAEHGNAYAALLLDRLASMGGVSEAAAHVDETIDLAIGKFMSERGREYGTEHAKVSLDHYENEESRVRSIAALAPGVIAAHVQDVSGSLNTHLPKVAQALQSQAVANAAYLKSKLPPQDSSPSLTPQLDKQKASDPDKASFLRSVRAVEGGPGGVAKRLADGSLSTEDVDWLKSQAPKSYQELKTKILEKCASLKRPLDYDKRTRLGLLFDIATDPTLDPVFVQVVQEHYKTPAPQPPQAAQQAHKVPAKVGILKTLSTPSEQAQGADHA